MNRLKLLHSGANVRESMLHNYHHLGPDDGQQLARRFLYEVGEVMADIHGRSDAAAILYSVADAVTCKLPIEDFRLSKKPLPPPPPFKDLPTLGKAGYLGGRVWKVVADRFFVGFILGMIARGQS